MCLNPAPHGHAIDWLRDRHGSFAVLKGTVRNPRRCRAEPAARRRPIPVRADCILTTEHFQCHICRTTVPDRSVPLAVVQARACRGRHDANRSSAGRRAWPDRDPRGKRPDRAGSHGCDEGRAGHHLPSDTDGEHPSRRPDRGAARLAGTSARRAGTAPWCPHRQAKGSGSRALRHCPSLTAPSRPRGCRGPGFAAGNRPSRNGRAPAPGTLRGRSPVSRMHRDASACHPLHGG